MHNLPPLFTPLSITESDLDAQQAQIFDLLQARNEYTEWQFVEINATAFEDSAGVVDASLNPIFPVPGLTFRAGYVDYEEENNFSWNGKWFSSDETADIGDGSMHLVRHGGRYIGTINLDTLAYELYDLTNGVQVVLEKNMTLYQEGMCDVSGQAEQVELTMADPCENLQLKIMFMVTPAAEAEEPDPEGKARLTVSQLNNIWTDSRVDKFAKFAGIVYMSDISSMSNITESTRRADVDNWSDHSLYPDVSYHRNVNDADIVVFLQEISTAYIMASPKT